MQRDAIRVWCMHCALQVAPPPFVQVMAVTAVQDGQKSIHAAAISGFAAAESDLTALSHAKAEQLLNPRDTYEGDTCVADGAPCLAKAAETHYSGITMAGCRRHIGEGLLKTAAGRVALPVYQQLIVVPRTRREFADTLYDSLPKDSPLHDIPRHWICDAYLPDGVHNHGIRLNNPAEILNWMLTEVLLLGTAILTT